MDCSEGCPRAAVMFGLPGVRVLDAQADERGLRLTVETDSEVEGCRSCGVLAVLHHRREHRLHDTPFGHRRVLVRWRKRVWRCPEPACPTVTFTETHPLAAPRARLTRRAVVWAADALTEDDTTVSALARRLDVDWHTLRAATVEMSLTSSAHALTARAVGCLDRSGSPTRQTGTTRVALADLGGSGSGTRPGAVE